MGTRQLFYNCLIIILAKRQLFEPRRNQYLNTTVCAWRGFVLIENLNKACLLIYPKLWYCILFWALWSSLAKILPDHLTQLNPLSNFCKLYIICPKQALILYFSEVLSVAASCPIIESNSEKCQIVATSTPNFHLSLTLLSFLCQ